MRKRVGVYLLIAAILASIFVGCSGGTEQSASQPASVESTSSQQSEASEVQEDSASGEEISMRAMWWGSQVRHDGTIAAIELYMERNPQINISYEYMGGSDYWQKLNTLIAANDVPDIVQMGNNFLTYESHIEMLDSYVERGLIDTANIQDSFLAPTTIKGQLMGISLGTNAHVMVYDPAIFQQAGVAEPTTSWTWNDYLEACNTINEKLGIYGSGDLSDFWGSAMYIMQTGNDVYNEDGTALGYDDPGITEGYWQMKKDVRSTEGVYPTPDIVASVKDIQGDLVVTGDAGIGWASSNQFLAMSEAAGRELKMTPYPKITADGPSGMYIRSAQAFCIAASSPHKDEAAKFINYFVNDLDANAILQGERGIPISSAVRETLMEGASDTTKAIFDYVDLIGEIASHPAPVEANGQIEIEDMTKRIGEELAFGQIEPAAAAERFYKEATEIIERNLGES